jgi:glycosyl hydrolase family 12
MTRFSPLVIAGLLAAAAPAVPAQAATAARAGSGTARSVRISTLCQRYQHLTVVTAQGAQFVVKNDNYGGQRECLAIRGQRPNFTVSQSQLPAWHAKPQAYPFVMRGCSWGTCSPPGSGLPEQVSALQQPVATWYTTQVANGKWDAAFDTWFGTQPMTTGQADGAELMIWLRARHIKVPPRTPVVRIEHIRWYLLHWRACHGGTCWNYVQFRRVWPVLRVHHLHLLPFIHRAETRGWIQPAWWLENIEAGFELWQGGAGLATDWFWARA